MTVADRLLYLVVILSLPWLFVYTWQPVQQAEYAEVRVGHALYQRINLAENKLLTIPGKLGNSILEVLDHKIRFKESPCTAKRCIHSGWLHNTNTVTACLPNGISVSLEPGTINGSASPYDSINF